MEKRPNILLITSDQQRKDSMGVYNSKLATPCLDALARDGVTFDRAYTPHPTCTPARASILCGQYGSKHGAYTIGTSLDDDALKVTDVLSGSGYETYLIGKPHFKQQSGDISLESEKIGRDEDFWRGFNGPYFGFQHVSIFNGHTSYPKTAGMHYRLWLKDKGLTDEDIDRYFAYQTAETFRDHGAWNLPRDLNPTVYVAETTKDFLDSHTRNSGDQPFFLWASFVDPHDPHMVPEPYASMYDPNEVDIKPYVEGEFDNMPHYYQELYDKDYRQVSFGDEYGLPSAPSGKFFGDEQYFREITAVHHGMCKLIDEEVGKIIDKLKDLGLYDNTLIIYTTDHGDYLGNHGFVYKGFPSYEEVFNIPFIVKNIGSENSGTRSSALLSTVDIAGTVLSLAGIDIPAAMDSVNQLPVFTGKADKVREAVLIENRPVEKGFYQQMLVTDQYKLVAYMDCTEGELFDLKNDPDQYHNLWSDPNFVEIKTSLLGKLLGGNQGLATEACLTALWAKMHAEEPVQHRTSFA